ncbi:response regulator [Nocardia carnea]|uniref:response regulator n=1 Tax=Nocardia carnea TaxID=37328 RepID=UPI0024558348|nr:response regulator [Nocardia carnea]
MRTEPLRVLIVEDDFRIADLHAEIVESVPGFTVTATVATIAAARARDPGPALDLALIDVYLPDGSGIDLVREMRCDTMVLTADSDGETVRSALAAGALGYFVKPFPPAALSSRLTGYARYRRLLADPQVDHARVEAALTALRPAPAPGAPAPVTSPTKDLVLEAITGSHRPMSAGEVADAIGVSRPTAQRHLTALAGDGVLRMRLRYGQAGRPEQEYSLSSER